MRNSNNILILLLAFQTLIFLPEKSLYSQNTIFIDETTERLPQIEDMSHYSEFGDIDLDGDMDIFVSNSNFEGVDIPNLILLNNGEGFFSIDSSGMIPQIRTNINRMTLGDIEVDGDLDIVVSVDEDWNLLLVNNGLGYFTDESDDRLPNRIFPWRSTDAVFSDIDSDKDLDFIVANFGEQQNLLRLNDGAGFFVSANDQFPSDRDNSLDVVGAEIDGDFDIDIYVCNAMLGGGDRLMINNGEGFFTDVSGIQILQDNNTTNGAVFGDVDTDGDFDLVIVNSFFASNRIFINRGDGYFDDRTGDLLPLESAESVNASFGDVNNNGDLDLLIANHASGGIRNQLFINNGLGGFTDQTSSYLPIQELETDILLLCDVDGDGDLDIFECNHNDQPPNWGKQNRLLINQSTPDSFPPNIPRTFHHPDTGDTTNPYLITTTVWDNISVVIGEIDISLFYRSVSESDDADFTEIPMLDCGGFLYRENIPAQQSGTTVEYYIKAEDKMGNISYDPPSAPDSVFSFLADVSVGIDDEPSVPSLPKIFSLSQNYPNPFNPSTTIFFDILCISGQTQPVSLTVYDIRGRRVRTLFDSKLEPGSHKIHWDSRNDRGQPVASGIYLYTLKAGEERFTRKMTILK
jgi:hypothetical protein